MTKRARRAEHRGVRIIAGRWRGRRILLPAGTKARPTPDRVRETLFNWLGRRIEGARCLDLFAGSGILGLEALSRGAAQVQFVESDRRLAARLTSSLDALGFAGSVSTERVERFLDQPVDAPVDIVFLDPPYELALAPLVARLDAYIGRGTKIYAERAADDGLPDLPGLAWIKRGRAGAVVFGLAQSVSSA